MPVSWPCAIDPLTPAIVYAGVGGFIVVGVFRSTGGGWSRVQCRPAERRCHGSGNRPADAEHPQCGTGGGVLKSTNGAGNWSAINTGLTSIGVLALAIDPVTPSTLYAGTGDGVCAIQFTRPPAAPRLDGDVERDELPGESVAGDR